jgi:hypothetical protein
MAYVADWRDLYHGLRFFEMTYDDLSHFSLDYYSAANVSLPRVTVDEIVQYCSD